MATKLFHIMPFSLKNSQTHSVNHYESPCTVHIHTKNATMETLKIKHKVNNHETFTRTEHEHICLRSCTLYTGYTSTIASGALCPVQGTAGHGRGGQWWAWQVGEIQPSRISIPGDNTAHFLDIFLNFSTDYDVRSVCLFTLYYFKIFYAPTRTWDKIVFSEKLEWQFPYNILSCWKNIYI